MENMKVFDAVEIYENERASAFGGWSSSSLLPTDRSAFTNKDASVGWNTLDEANEGGLLSKGWDWVANSTWTPKSHAACDEEGWIYAVSFSNIDEGSPVKGILHFVRRRRLERLKVFNESKICKISDWTCDHCDNEKVDSLSNQLLQCLSAASYSKHPRQLTVPKMNVLKDEFLAALPLGKAPVNLDAALGPLFNQFSLEGRNAWSIVSASIASGDPAENLLRRTAEVAAEHFRSPEREALAKMLIRQNDTEHLFHCHIKNCGQQCDFAIVHCENEHCVVTVSRKWLRKHDNMCPEKIVECERSCGDMLPRRSMSTHLKESCPLRPVDCPFACIGCCSELVHRTLPEHLDNCCQSHLLLTLGVVASQKITIDNLSRQLKAVEEQQNKNTAVLGGFEAVIGTAVAGIEVSERRQTKKFQSEISTLNSKIDSRISEVNNRIQAEVNKLDRSLGEISKEVKKK